MIKCLTAHDFSDRILNLDSRLSVITTILFLFNYSFPPLLPSFEMKVFLMILLSKF